MSAPAHAATPVAAAAGVLAEIGELKRVRAAGHAGSVAARGFARAWAALAGGADATAVARAEAAGALAATRLGAIDADVLAACGLDDAAAADVLRRAFEEAARGLPEPVADALRTAPAGVGPDLCRIATQIRPTPAGQLPWWVAALAEQPRAGATRPGHPRLVLEPAESHAEHCWTVAVGAVLLASAEGAGPAAPFLCGLAHHLHNATLPDSGFAGEVLLAEHLDAMVAHTTAAALSALPAPLREATKRALALRDAADTREQRAFHAADVLDRVLQQRYHAAAAAFTLERALDDLELVHPGPLQAYGDQVVRAAGLR